MQTDRPKYDHKVVMIVPGNLAPGKHSEAISSAMEKYADYKMVNATYGSGPYSSYLFIFFSKEL